jgi:hypothetical protein
MNLADILDEACMLLEQRGRSLSHALEVLLARQISDSARKGERDHNKLLAAALASVIGEDAMFDGARVLN